PPSSGPGRASARAHPACPESSPQGVRIHRFVTGAPWPCHGGLLRFPRRGCIDTLEVPMAPRHPFRFGVVAARAESAPRWTNLARRAEELGFASFLIPDTLGPTLAPIPAL